MEEVELGSYVIDFTGGRSFGEGPLIQLSRKRVTTQRKSTLMDGFFSQS